MLLEVALPFAVACGTLGLAWLHSIFRWQNRASRGAWVVLTAACFATAVVNVRMAFRYLSADCADLIEKTLQLKPDKRPTLHQIMGHPWFANAL